MDKVNIDSEFTYLDWMISGHESLVNGDGLNFSSMTGNESFYCLHMEAFAGNEASIMDSIKQTAARLRDNIKATLKRIRDYFFGEGAEASERASDNAEKTLEDMGGIRQDAPVSDKNPARDSEAYIKPLEGGTEFQEMLKKYPEVGKVFEHLKEVGSKVSSSNTVGSLRNAMSTLKIESDKGVKVIENALRDALKAAEKATGKLNSPKIPKEDDEPEVKEAIKQENTENSQEAQDQTKLARLIGGARNKVVSVYTSISTNAKKIKEEPPKSDFKG